MTRPSDDEAWDQLHAEHEALKTKHVALITTHASLNAENWALQTLYTALKEAWEEKAKGDELRQYIADADWSKALPEASGSYADRKEIVDKMFAEREKADAKMIAVGFFRWWWNGCAAVTRWTLT